MNINLETPIAIMGNSGSGKTTLAKRLSQSGKISILDLDTIVWSEDVTPSRQPANLIQSKLEQFCQNQSNWIVEGCYGDLIEIVLQWKPQLIFLNPGEAICLRNCRDRPWEPHKYNSLEAQNSYLEYLLEWVSDYYHRTDEMSYVYHRRLFESYSGWKWEINLVMMVVQFIHRYV